MTAKVDSFLESKEKTQRKTFKKTKKGLVTYVVYVFYTSNFDVRQSRNMMAGGGATIFFQLLDLKSPWCLLLGMVSCNMKEIYQGFVVDLQERDVDCEFPVHQLCGRPFEEVLQ